MKVICAGAAKTGTKSIATALRLLGYDKVYDVEEAIEYAFEEWEAVWGGSVPNLDRMFDKVYSEKVEAVVDLPHSYFFDEFLQRWPEAKVILMVREPDEWFESYEKMTSRAVGRYQVLWIFYYLSPTLRRLLKWYYNLSVITLGEVNPHPLLWKKFLKRHNTYVRATVPKPQLLEFNVQQGWKPLCDFLGKEIPEIPFPCENQADDPCNVADRMMRETWIAKKMIREIKIIVSLFFLAIAFLFTYLLC